MRNSSSLDWLRFMHTPNDYRVSPNTFNENPFTTPQKVIKETIELINQTY